MPVLLLRIARQALAEVDHEADDGRRLMGLPDDPEAEHLDAPAERLDRLGDEAAVPRFDPGSIIADEAPETARLEGAGPTSRASVDLPEPDAPRIRSPASPMSTQPAWMVWGALTARSSPSRAGRGPCFASPAPSRPWRPRREAG